jgi:hypothetical protein
VRPDQAQDDEERPVHHAFQVSGKAHAGEGKGLHQPARGESQKEQDNPVAQQPVLLRAAYWLALVGTYLNWAVTLAAAAWEVGGTTMPLAAGGHLGTPDQELTLLVGLRALNVAMFASCFLVVWGLRGEGPPWPGSRSPV